MSFKAKAIVLAAGLVASTAPVGAQQGAAAPAPAAAQQAARCGGLFCDMYYASNSPAQPGMPEPAPGQPGTTRLACHDFVCGMFGGRTPDQPVAAAAEPAPAVTEPAVKPKKKHAAKRAAEHLAERTAKNEAKPAKAPEPSAQ